MKDFKNRFFTTTVVSCPIDRINPDASNGNNLLNTTPKNAAGIAGASAVIIQSSEAAANAAGGYVGKVIADNLSGYTLASIIPAAIGNSALGGPVAPIIIGIISSALMAAGIAGFSRYALNESALNLLKDAEARIKVLENEKSKSKPSISALFTKEQRMVVQQWQNVVKENKTRRLAQDIAQKAPDLLLTLRAKNN